jgi:hypothetical protein
LLCGWGSMVARFFWYNIPKREKDILNDQKCTKWPLNLPNGREIGSMVSETGPRS